MLRTRFLVAASVLLPATAAAYKTKTTSSGAEVRWASGDVDFIVSLDDAPGRLEADEAADAALGALDTWQALLGDVIALVPTVVADRADTRGGDGLNVFRWATDDEDPDIEDGVLAMTYATYRTSDGAIQDADIVVNGAEFYWFTGEGDDDNEDDDNEGGDNEGGGDRGCRRAFDLQSTLIHEVGHALGLSHSDEESAVMFPTTRACLLKRELHEDDVAGLARLYQELPPLSARSPDAGMAGCSAAGSSSSAPLGAALVLCLAFAIRLGRRALAASALAVALVGSTGGASAASLRWFDLDALAGKAQMTVRGKVIAQRVRRGVRGIETVDTLAVTECLRGSCPATFEIVRRGGELDGVGLAVEAQAEVAVGDEVVVFLRHRAGQLTAVGGVQGAFKLAAGQATRQLAGQQLKLPDGRWVAGGLERYDLAALRAAARR